MQQFNQINQDDPMASTPRKPIPPLLEYMSHERHKVAHLTQDDQRKQLEAMWEALGEDFINQKKAEFKARMDRYKIEIAIWRNQNPELYQQLRRQKYLRTQSRKKPLQQQQQQIVPQLLVAEMKSNQKFEIKINLEQSQKKDLQEERREEEMRQGQRSSQMKGQSENRASVARKPWK